MDIRDAVQSININTNGELELMELQASERVCVHVCENIRSPGLGLILIKPLLA